MKSVITILLVVIAFKLFTDGITIKIDGRAKTYKVE
jgi:hypothetical protein